MQWYVFSRFWNLFNQFSGMFLWVRLVLDSLHKIYSLTELRRVVEDLPTDLDALFTEILSRISQPSGLDHYGGVSRIFSWICNSQRPLHKHELLQGLVTHRSCAGNGIDDVPVVQLLDHCKPFIEERLDSSIAFVHFSIKEHVFRDPVRDVTDKP
jgi:hypothetical protein